MSWSSWSLMSLIMKASLGTVTMQMSMDMTLRPMAEYAARCADMLWSMS